MQPVLLPPPNNLATRFFENAQSFPDKTALVEPILWRDGEILKERIWTYGEFGALVKSYQSRLDKENLKDGARVLVMLPISVQMYALLAAIFATGAIPVFIDHTMERKQFISALNQADIKAVFSTRKFFKYRLFLRALWRTKLYAFNESGLGIQNWEKIRSEITNPKVAELATDSLSLITFTSGSSGRPKAADRTLRILHYQREIGRSLWREGDRELTLFPMVILANLVFGVTTVLPALPIGEMDSFVGERLCAQIRKHNIDRLAAPPSVLNAMTSRSKNSAGCPSLERLVSGGAPMPKWLIQKVREYFPKSEGHVIYGSTEAEPISHVSFDDILSQGDSGYLVGKPIPEINIELTPSGEILLNGPHVVQRYLFNDEDNRTTKIRDETGNVWHRTRDTGIFDHKGQLWLTGRVSDRVRFASDDVDVYPFEHVIENQLSTRVALVQDSRLKLHLFVEADTLSEDSVGFISDVFRPLRQVVTVKNISRIPVDKRHFWKIDRGALL